MSSEERKKILQMVAEGKISPTQAATLMRALDSDAPADEEEVEVIPTAAGKTFESTAAPEFEEIKSRARRFALIPLWIGILLTVFSAWVIYSIQQNGGTSFWFYCMVLPLMFGMLLITLGAGGRSSRWLYVDVDRRNARAGDGPRRITLGFPLPLGLLAWFFRTFGSNFQGMSGGRIEGIIQIMNATKNSDEPFIVNVEDGANGEHVRVFIG